MAEAAQKVEDWKVGGWSVWILFMAWPGVIENTWAPAVMTQWEVSLVLLLLLLLLRGDNNVWLVSLGSYPAQQRNRKSIK